MCNVNLLLRYLLNQGLDVTPLINATVLEAPAGNSVKKSGTKNSAAP